MKELRAGRGKAAQRFSQELYPTDRLRLRERSEDRHAAVLGVTEDRHVASRSFDADEDSGRGRKARYARSLVVALDDDRVPQPLEQLLSSLPSST